MWKQAGRSGYGRGGLCLWVRGDCGWRCYWGASTCHCGQPASVSGWRRSVRLVWQWFFYYFFLYNFLIIPYSYFVSILNTLLLTWGARNTTTSLLYVQNELFSGVVKIPGASILHVVFELGCSTERRNDPLIISDASGRVIASRSGREPSDWSQEIYVIGKCVSRHTNFWLFQWLLWMFSLKCFQW